MKRTLKIGVAGLLAASAAVGTVSISEHLFKDAVRQRIETSTGLNAQFSKADLGLWPRPHFAAEDLRLSDAGPNHQPVLSVARISFDLAWDNLFSAKRQIRNMTLTAPRLSLVEGEMNVSASPFFENVAKQALGGAQLDGLTVQNGSVTIQNKARGASATLEAVDLRMTSQDNGSLTLTGAGRFGTHDVGLQAEAASIPDLVAGIPTRLKAQINISDLDAPPLTLQSAIRLTDHALHFTAGPQQLLPNQVRATGALDWSRPVPFLSLALFCDALDLGSANLNPASIEALQRTSGQSDAAHLDLAATRLLDTSIEASIKTFNLGQIKAAAVQAKATLQDGVLRIGLHSGDFYQGSLHAELAVEPNQTTPGESLELKLTNVNAAPFLSDLANVQHVEGKFDLALGLRTSGSDAHAMASALSGTSKLHFHDGAITGIDAPATFRTILAYMPPAWHGLSDKIAVSTLDGTFTIAEGTAATEDLHINSPIIDTHGKGKIDLADQSFDLRFDPKVVASGKTPVSANDTARPTLDLGVAVLVRGPWSDPQISADLSGLTNDPQGAINKLGALGQEFLGNTGSAPNGQMSNDEIMKGVGDLLGGLLGGTSQHSDAVAMQPQTSDQRNAKSKSSRDAGRVHGGFVWP